MEMALTTQSFEAKFIKEATKLGMVGLKGHRPLVDLEHLYIMLWILIVLSS